MKIIKNRIGGSRLVLALLFLIPVVFFTFVTTGTILSQERSPAPWLSLLLLVKSDLSAEITPCAFPTGFLVDTPTTVLLHAEIASTPNAKWDSVRAFKADKDFKPIGAPLCTLRDEGKVNDGDEIGGDGIFSCKVLFEESSPKSIQLVVQARAGEAKIFSPGFTLEVVTSLTSQEINVVLTAQEEAAKIWEEKLDLLGDTMEARQETVSGILQLEGVTSAGINEADSTIWIEYECGIGGGLLFIYPDIEGQELSQLTSSPQAEHACAAPNLTSTSGQVSYSPPKATQDIHVGNNKVLIWNPDKSIDLQITNQFRNSTCPQFDVDYLKDDECTVDSIKNFVNYGTIIIEAHGSQHSPLTESYQQITFLTGEKADDASMIKYSLQLKPTPRRQLLVYGKIPVEQERIPREQYRDYFIATDDFISSLAGTFTRSIIYSSSCLGFHNNNMANAFLKKGAGVYYGFTYKTCISYAYEIINELFSHPGYLVAEGKNVNDAYTSIKKKVDDGKFPSDPRCAGNTIKRDINKKIGGGLKYPKDCTVSCEFSVTVVEHLKTVYEGGDITYYDGDGGPFVNVTTGQLWEHTNRYFAKWKEESELYGNRNGKIEIVMNSDRDRILSIDFTEKWSRGSNKKEYKLKGGNIDGYQTDYEGKSYRVFEVKRDEACNHISKLTLSAEGVVAMEKWVQTIESFDCDDDSEISVILQMD
jgi:hypothetical protein